MQIFKTTSVFFLLRKIVRQSIINPDWDFGKMGIGGLDTEFNAIFRRAFASRVFPPELVEQLGCKHVKGILLYGPPVKYLTDNLICSVTIKTKKSIIIILAKSNLIISFL